MRQDVTAKAPGRLRALKEVAMTLTLYGIPNCDTVKKARVWLADKGVAFDFHDYKKQGVDRGLLETWVAEHGWEVILNRSGTTFRALPDADKAELTADKAIGLMLAQPSMIKRPILDLGERRLVGFKPDAYAAVLI
jgi:arsenate reductase